MKAARSLWPRRPKRGACAPFFLRLVGFRRFTASAGALLLAAALLAAGARERLWIYAEGGRLAAALPAGRGFALRFIHSINLSPVEEFFSLGGGSSLILEKVSFAQFGTGMPTGGDEVLGMEDGLYVTKPSRRFESIELRVSPVPGHELRLDGKVIPLTRWAPPGGMLRLRASPDSGP